MKILSAVTMGVLLSGLAGNVSASLGNTEFEMAINEQMGAPLLQKVANHIYKSKKYSDGTGMSSIYWTGKKVFQKGDVCLVVEQNFSHFESAESEDGNVVEKEPVVNQITSVKDCRNISALI
jgi:hypothetical protein